MESGSMRGIWAKKRSPDVERIRAPPKPHTRLGETRNFEKRKNRASIIFASLQMSCDSARNRAQNQSGFFAPGGL
jgi:hypothetical protein